MRPDATTIRALLPEWMVDEGTIPQLAVGQRADLALQIWVWSRSDVDAAAVADGMELLSQPDPQRNVGSHYHATGVAGPADAFSHSWILRVHGIPFAAAEPHNASPHEGARVAVRGTVAVDFGDQWDDLPGEGSRLWDIRRITLQQRALERGEAQGPWQPRCGEPPPTHDVDRVDRDRPEGSHIAYVLELDPVPTAQDA